MTLGGLVLSDKVNRVGTRKFHYENPSSLINVNATEAPPWPSRRPPGSPRVLHIQARAVPIRAMGPLWPLRGPFWVARRGPRAFHLIAVFLLPCVCPACALRVSFLAACLAASWPPCVCPACGPWAAQSDPTGCPAGGYRAATGKLNSADIQSLTEIRENNLGLAIDNRPGCNIVGILHHQSTTNRGYQHDCKRHLPRIRLRSLRG